MKRATFLRTSAGTGLVIALVLGIVTTNTSSAKADCGDVHSGDELYDWVSQSAGSRSHDLAAADVEARVFNEAHADAEALNADVKTVAKELEGLALSIEGGEAGLPTTSELDSAIARRRDADRIASLLLAARPRLDALSFRLAESQRLRGHAELMRNGFGTLGRETLISSVTELGDSAAMTLRSRFEISVSITVDTNGRYVQSKLTPDFGLVDTLAIAILWKFPPALMVYAWARMLVMSWEAEQCERKLEGQRQKIRDAATLIPKKLISVGDVLILYEKRHREEMDRYKDYYAGLVSLVALLHQEWKDLYAYNATRLAVADSVLTTERVRYVREQAGVDGALAAIFDNVALGRLASELSDYRNFVHAQEVALEGGCADDRGLTLLERHGDAVAYGRRVVIALRPRLDLAPVLPLIDALSKQLDASIEAHARFTQAFARGSCTRKLGPGHDAHSGTAVVAREQQDRGFSDALARIRARPIVVTPSLPPAQPARSGELRWAPMFANRALGGFSLRPETGRTAGATWSSQFCVMQGADGQAYRCGPPTAGLPAYTAQLSGAGRSLTDVLFGSRDGGYAQDDRRVSFEIGEMDRIVQQRIAALRDRIAGPKLASVDWLVHNRGALTTATNEAGALGAVTTARRDEFVRKNGGLLESTRAELAAFSRSPASVAAARDLLVRRGGTDATLSDFPASRIPSDAPVISAVSAQAGAYGTESNAVVKEISQERRKQLDGLVGSPEAEEALELADRFVSRGPRIARALIDDARSIRYAKTGKPKLTTAVLGRYGDVERAARTGSALPAGSMIMRSRDFVASTRATTERVSTVRGALGTSVVDPLRRRDVLAVTERLVAAANEVFWGGRLGEGAAIIGYASVVLDAVATWSGDRSIGTDAYEALTGTELLTGAPVSVAARLEARLRAEIAISGRAGVTGVAGARGGFDVVVDRNLPDAVRGPRSKSESSIVKATARGLATSRRYERDGNGTQCNYFVNDFSEIAFGYSGFRGLTANEIVKHLATSDAKADGWEPIYAGTPDHSPEIGVAEFKQAQELANTGYLVLVGLQVGDGPSGGHVAVIVPGQLEDSGPLWRAHKSLPLQVPTIAQAGTRVYDRAKFDLGFGATSFLSGRIVVYVRRPPEH